MTERQQENKSIEENKGTVQFSRITTQMVVGLIKKYIRIILLNLLEHKQQLAGTSTGDFCYEKL